ncbi:MAG: MFS transporter, partial [Candidatus Kapabacteria bacterium]|nr:MFS transporter [Candidatus Kapabacteria bacterium]MDW7997356.1 MFS transporter [Bacteroidota bacterium]
AAILSTAAALWTLVGLPEPTRLRVTHPSLLQNVRQVWSYKPLRPFLLFDFLFWSCQAVYQTGFALLVHRRFGLGERHVGYLLGFVGALGVLTQVGLVGWLARRIGDGRAFRLGVIIAAFGLGGAAVMPSVPLFLLCLVPAAVGSGVAIPSLLSVLSRATPAAYQGGLQGVATSLEGLARVVGPLWGNGGMAFSPIVPFGSAALVLFAVGIVASQYVQRLTQVHAHTESISERVG